MSTPRIKVVTKYGTFTRQTARNYAYFVITTGESEGKIRNVYAKLKTSNERYIARYHAVVEAMKLNSAKFCWQIEGNNLHESDLIRSGKVKLGQLIFADEVPKGLGGSAYLSIEQYQEYLDGVLADNANIADRCEAAIAKEKARGYHDIQWSSRLELAAKYADDLRRRGFENVKVIEISTGKAVL